MLAACRRMLSRVFGDEERERAVDALEEGIEKIEASIDSGEKTEWTEHEITRELERATGERFVLETELRVAVTVLCRRHRTEKSCSYIFKPRHKAVN